MKTRTKKFIVKILIEIPVVYFCLVLLEVLTEASGVFQFLDGFNILIAVVIAISVVFNNAVEYEKFSDLKDEDFLEASHQIVIEYSQEKWDILMDLIDQPFTIFKIADMNENQISLLVLTSHSLFDGSRIWFNRYILVSKFENQIRIKIRKSYFNMFPDLGRNYKILLKLTQVLEGESISQPLTDI